MVIAVLCDRGSWHEREEFSKEMEELLGMVLPIEDSIPSHDIFIVFI